LLWVTQDAPPSALGRNLRYEEYAQIGETRMVKNQRCGTKIPAYSVDIAFESERNMSLGNL
jgi:hypothetical protein